ncbi:hypothetical protein ACTQ4F_02870 [Streptococcus alactolyticus]|uniref:hypothetical protein n=1 Tax=Streptococcus alactolyticus TaxID=29389 RepID=UPI003F986530
MTMKEYAHSCAEELKKLPTQRTVVKVCNKIRSVLDKPEILEDMNRCQWIQYWKKVECRDSRILFK